MSAPPEDPTHPAPTADVGSVHGPKGASYGNFHDPVGLVMRMLRSGNRVARSALWRAAAEWMIRPVDYLLGGVVARRLRRAGTSQLPLFLIVGLPRSGTTLVYQTLANSLPFSYFNNLSALFPRATITISAWWPRSFDPPQRDASTSYYGHTAGLRGVNEGLHVWNRWFGDDRNAAPRRLEPAAAADMRRFFAAWSETFARPLLNKSNRNTFCVEALADALPTAVFIAVRRDPVYVAQSLLQARKTVHGSVHVGWGAGASRPGRSSSGDALADVVDQVVYCDQELHSQLARLAPERVIDIAYEDFCKDPRSHVQAVWERVRAMCPPGLELGEPRLDALQPMADSDVVTVEATQFERLRELVEASRALGART